MEVIALTQSLYIDIIARYNEPDMAEDLSNDYLNGVRRLFMQDDGTTIPVEDYYARIKRIISEVAGDGPVSFSETLKALGIEWRVRPPTRKENQRLELTVEAGMTVITRRSLDELQVVEFTLPNTPDYQPLEKPCAKEYYARFPYSEENDYTCPGTKILTTRNTSLELSDGIGLQFRNVTEYKCNDRNCGDTEYPGGALNHRDLINVTRYLLDLQLTDPSFAIGIEIKLPKRTQLIEALKQPITKK